MPHISNPGHLVSMVRMVRMVVTAGVPHCDFSLFFDLLLAAFDSSFFDSPVTRYTAGGMKKCAETGTRRQWLRVRRISHQPAEIATYLHEAKCAPGRS